MARKRNRQKTPADAIGPAFGLALLLILALSKGDIRRVPQTFKTVSVWGLGLAAVSAILFFLKRKKKNPEAKLAAASVTDALTAIDWFQFEKVIARLLTLEGFTVEVQGGAQADGGVDLIAHNPATGATQLIQCKFWNYLSYSYHIKRISRSFS